MKHSFLILMLGLSISTCLVGQLSLEKLDYANYMPGEQRYRFLDYRLALESKNNNSIGNSLLDGFIASSTSFRNTARRQVEKVFSVGLKQTTSLGISYSGNFTYKSKNYLFKKRPLLFIPVDAGMLLSSSGRSFGNHDAHLATGIGYGRIHVVNEIAIAERILTQLNEASGNRIQIDEAKVFDLANLMTELKNKRYFTNRGEWKEELEVLEYKLNEIGLDLSAEASKKMLEELYETESLIRREQGNVLTLKGVQGFGNTNFFDNDYVDLSLSYERKKYLGSGLQWNQAFTLNVGKSILNNNITRYYSKEEYKLVGINYNAVLHFLPNKDTRFSTIFNAGYRRAFDYNHSQIEDPSSLYEDRLSGFNVGLKLEYEKRFRRNMRVAVGLGIDYSEYHGTSLTPTLKFSF